MNDDNNITFLIGAGASAEALPTVEGIPSELKDFLDKQDTPEWQLSNTHSFDSNPPPFNGETKREIQNVFKADLSWFIENCKSPSTIDTFAKKIIAQKKPDQMKQLKKLKALTTVFFLYKQWISKPDPRYDSFIASLINEKTNVYPLPGSVKILSWNYDLQFELAYSSYLGKTDIAAIQSHLQVFPSPNIRQTDIKTDEFSLIKLNGSTLFFDQRQSELKHMFLSWQIEADEKKLIGTLIRNYFSLVNNENFLSQIRFAWESDDTSEQVLKTAKDLTKDTRTLVVIGYSFPFFNRKVDREIIRNMSRLNRVYFQAPPSDIDNYVYRFNSIRPDIDKSMTSTIPATDRFWLPPEL